MADHGTTMPDAPRVVFMGTADLAATVLRRLAADDRWSVVLAVSQPDRPKGRDLALQPTPVKQTALEAGIPVDQPAKARDPMFLERLRTLAPDLIVVAAYGQLLPQALLDIPRHGCLNVHTSLLPAYRGAAPIQWALADGLSETGVTLMRMDAGLDTGPIVTTATTPIGDDDTGQSLHDRLADLGGDLLVRSLPDYLAGRLPPHPQPAEGVSHARKITKDDGRLIWDRPAVELWRRLRAFRPWPGAFCHAEGGGKTRLVKVHDAVPCEGSGQPGERIDGGKGRLVVACGTGALELRILQPEGGRRMEAAAFLAGHPLERFT
jgi:methionyl-tRNA formyltransferase